MATVWAFRVSAFTSNPASGWSHTINFNSTANLVNGLEQAGVRGNVERLAIVAHGDLPGQVLMDGSTPVTPGALRDLATYLTHSGMLIFVSCIAGAVDGGSAFLTSISRELPGRVIVGFNTWGFLDTSMGAPNDPGNVQAARGAARPVRGAPRLTPWCVYAKWAYRAAIVRLPAEEQKGRQGKRCANPHCPGHASENDRCVYSTWGNDPTLVRYQP